MMREEKSLVWNRSLRSRGETICLELSRTAFEHILSKDIVLEDKVLQAVQMVEQYRNIKTIQSIW
jgi:hypothetical protein